MATFIKRLASIVALAAASAVGGTTLGAQAPVPGRLRMTPSEQARADSARYPYTVADIAFMKGMIHHHSQAIVMSRMAPSRGASASVRTLADRIINAQQDEIAVMQNWLRDRNQTPPDPLGTATAPTAAMNHAGHDMSAMSSSSSSTSSMPGMSHDAAMPGMLTQAQLKQLDAARGADFDRLFLQFMIQHHKGATSMVDQLFNTYGAAQDVTVFKFASDVNVDQTTEIARMQRMLVALLIDRSAP